MKKSIKLLNKIFVLTLLLIVIFTLSGCGSMKKELSRSKEVTITFFQYLNEEKYEDATKLFHPDTNYTVNALKDTVEKLEQSYNLNFNEEFKIERSTSINISLFDSQFDGTRAEVTFEALLGEDEIYIYILTVENDNGYGIYSLNIQNR